MYITCTLGVQSQKRIWDALELELRTAVSHHVGAGNRTWVL